MGPSPDLLGRLTRVLAAQPEASLPQRLCGAFTEIAGVDGAAITLGLSIGERSILCTSTASAEAIEDLQDVLREGPSLDAARNSHLTSLTDLEQRAEAWPLLVESLEALGPVPRIDAFPILPHDSLLGVMTTHQPRDTAWTLDLDEAQFLVNAIGVAILGNVEQDDIASERWMTRDRIAQATGMVIAQLRLPPHDALAVLRAHAYAEDATLADVSSRVLERTLRFVPDQHEESE